MRKITLQMHLVSLLANTVRAGARATPPGGAGVGERGRGGTEHVGPGGQGVLVGERRCGRHRLLLVGLGQWSAPGGRAAGTRSSWCGWDLAVWWGWDPAAPAPWRPDDVLLVGRRPAGAAAELHILFTNHDHRMAESRGSVGRLGAREAGRMCNGAHVAHSSCSRSPSGPGNRWNDATGPNRTPG